MANELLILRHGKSDWDAPCDDFHRPLKDRGKRDAQRIGIWLAQQDLRPDIIISSPAERALVTAQKCCKAMGMSVQKIHADQRIYEADSSTLVKVLADCPKKAKRVMLVGHNPGLEVLLLWLSEENLSVPVDGKLLPTASLARLKINRKWNKLSRGCAKLKSLTRPRELPKKFPYPSPDGTELRDRPAYYYTQSSVIPWRINNGVPEILVILSSQKNHWVVPKGIWEPGLSAQESAASEALEEAGVEGKVSKKAIGSYSYPKWGASCTVEVYSMEVTRELPDDEWEESHRDRQWVPLHEAVARVKHEQLKPMLQKLGSKLKKIQKKFRTEHEKK